MTKYDSNLIEGHFDKDPTKEWERLDNSPKGKVQFHIHQHYLQKYIKRDSRVLEVGSGPGRFTIELAKLGAKVSVADISGEQLRLNEEKVKEAGFEDQIEWRKKLDILNLEGVPDNEFDATVCYGGPLSYVMDLLDTAIIETIRVTKPGGIILSSVMSCLGSFHHFLNGIFDEWEDVGPDLYDECSKTGDVMGKLAGSSGHHCHMFRWSEYKETLSKHPVEILEASAANFLSNGSFNDEFLTSLMDDEEKWNMFLKWELDFCREPGAIDGGTHMIAILRKLP
ncbi:MAG: class I SAM-dependent methyltransferase [Candidatus Thorarchaeota archaeon]